MTANLIANLIVVTRSWEPGTVAVVRFLSREKRLSVPEALQRIQVAVTRWIEETDEGRTAWKDSHADFNVGDLIDYTANEKLIALLDTCGIRELSVEGLAGVSTGWAFDDVLRVDTEP